MEELEDKLFHAYFRHFGKYANQPSRYVDYLTFKGQEYAILSNINGVLAVYKLYPDDSPFDFRLVTNQKLIDEISEELKE